MDFDVEHKDEYIKVSTVHNGKTVSADCTYDSKATREVEEIHGVDVKEVMTDQLKKEIIWRIDNGFEFKDINE
jgi:hypothetical protein